MKNKSTHHMILNFRFSSPSASCFWNLKKNAQRNHHPVNLRTKLLKAFASKLDSSKKLAFWNCPSNSLQVDSWMVHRLSVWDVSTNILWRKYLCKKDTYQFNLAEILVFSVGSTWNTQKKTKKTIHVSQIVSSPNSLGSLKFFQPSYGRLWFCSFWVSPCRVITTCTPFLLEYMHPGTHLVDASLRNFHIKQSTALFINMYHIIILRWCSRCAPKKKHNWKNTFHSSMSVWLDAYEVDRTFWLVPPPLRSNCGWVFLVDSFCRGYFADFLEWLEAGLYFYPSYKWIQMGFLVYTNIFAPMKKSEIVSICGVYTLWFFMLLRLWCA